MDSDRDNHVRTTGTRLGTPSPVRQTPPTTLALTAGQRVDQYELIRELGKGGMGVVFAARDVKLGRRVAIKFLKEVDREVKERFLVEARATAQCNHENIVVIHQVGEWQSYPFMVLEYLEGLTLRDLIGPFRHGTRMPPSRVIEIALQIARALARAHERAIVHRDLKPENVFVTAAGPIKVLDFGIAKALGGRDRAGLAGDSTELLATRAGSMVGTLPYMSPEQMRSATQQLDHRADLWALGIIMFEMLSGRHPIDAVDATTLITNIVLDDPLISIGEVVPDVQESLVRLVDQLIRKRREDRIQSATELVRRLEELLPGRGARRLDEGESPFVGLSAFQFADADRFFGRDRDVVRMVARVRELPLTGVIGPSGVGKSSFVRAGVAPALRASGEMWEMISLRPGRQAMAALASTVQRAMVAPSDRDASEHQFLTERLRSEPGYLGALLRERAQQIQGQLVLFVDQFEELYTLVGDPAERRAFTAALAGVADDPAAPLRVVVSIRSDFVDRLVEDPRFTEELAKGLTFLAPPDADGLREALVSPIEMAGHRFESDEMVSEMLGALANTVGALPLLQFAAAKLWDKRDRTRKLITQDSYRAIGGISGALAAHADDVVGKLPAPAQLLAARVFERLVTPERTRAVVDQSDLHDLASDRAEVDRVIEQLVAGRLLVIQKRDGQDATVEIVHESLIARWPKLQRWLDEGHEDGVFVAQLAAAAKQWDAKHRPPGMLWRGDAIDDAKRWYVQRPRALGKREQAFLDAGFALAARGRRAKRFGAIGAFAAMAAIAAGVSIAYVRVRAAEQRAQDNAAEATREATRANDAASRATAALQEKLQADARRLSAEGAKDRAEDDKKRAEDERKRAEDDARRAGGQLAKSREELLVANAGLERALEDAKKARALAEKASREATAATADAKQLAAKLAERVRQLEEEKKKMSTKLKE